MSILNGSATSSLRADVAAAAASKSNVTPISDRKVADFWLNIGLHVPSVDAEGNATTTFISLPVGLALDDMKPQVVKGANQDYINMVQTKNALLEALQKAAANLKPGERQPCGDLSIELYRRNEPAQQGKVGDNPLLASMMSLLSGKPN